MLLDLTRYRQPTASFSRTFQPSEMGADGDAYAVVEPVDLTLEIHKDKNRFRLVGDVRTTLELGCSRCAEPFQLPVSSSFDVRYWPMADAERDAEAELSEDDLETSYYADDQIDLNELMREQFYLALPMKPLCQEDCRGLCPHCGTNLNTARCSCTPVWEDPRLAALKSLQPRRDS
ncbi:MAG: DUF177 domain-containing protein [Vicinamibacterales bacterium]